MNKQTKLLTVAVALLGNLNLAAATSTSDKPTGTFPSTPTAKRLPLVHGTIAVNAQDNRNVQAKGRITDQEGEPIVGASVIQKGTKNATVTDIDGSFTLNVPTGSMLVVSYIGYAEQTVTASSNMNITLKSNVEKLDEVVVVGYGIQKKVNVIGSIASVDSKALESRGVADVSNMLTGQMSGVTITQNSGNPGQDGGTIRVRGVGSFGASPDPLVLIDGMPGNFYELMPADIESISVLKDASSAAIYGSRAANGVVLITTKRGAMGHTKVTYNGSVGLSKAVALPQMAHSYEYAEYLNMAIGKENFSQEAIRKFRDGSDPDNYADENMIEKLLGGHAFQTKHELSVNGGNQNITYALSAGYLRQDGLLKNNYMDKYTGRANIGLKFNDKLKLDVRLAGAVKDRNEPSTPGPLDFDGVESIIQQALRFPGLTPTYLQNGELGLGPKQQGTPVAWANSSSFFNEGEKNLKANAELTFSPIKGLSLRAIGGYNFGLTEEKHYRNELQLTEGRKVGPSKLTNTMYWNAYKTFQFIANYNLKIKRHDVSLLAGYTWEDECQRFVSGSRNKVATDDKPYLSMGDANGQTNSGDGYDWALQSVIGRLTYNYDQRYLFELNMRYDGSSRFPTNSKYALFPSVSAGWRITEEKFWKDEPAFDFVNNLKLKASYGVLGNNNIGNYPYQTVYQLDSKHNYVFGGTYTQGAAITTFTDPNLKWERTRTSDVGIEAAFFNYALTFNATYFYRKTTDVLYTPAASVSDIFGLKLSKVNTGALENKGWEFEVGYTNHAGDFSYQINGNFSIISNKVLTLGLGNVQQKNGMVGNGTDLFIGYPMEMFYGYKTDGLFLTDDEVSTWADQKAIASGSKAGDIRYRDLTGDNKVTPDDRVYLGSRIPKYTFGLNLACNYKQFDFSMLLQGVAKVKGLLTRYAGWAFNQEGNIQKWQMEETWNVQKNNRYAKYPRLEATSNAGGKNTLTSDYWLLDASYLKVRNVQLGYTLPKNMARNMGIGSLRMYLSLDNPLAFHHYYKGWDPENTKTEGSYYPTLTTYTFGLTLSL